MSDRFIGRSKREWVNVNELVFSPSTQRESVSRAWISAHVGIFDPEKLGLITVNIRDGKKWVVDGMHRTELMRAVGWGDQLVEANVYRGLTEQEEASLFLGLDDRRKVSQTDRFRVRVTEGDPTAVAINNIVQGLGLRIGQRAHDRGNRTITAVNMVETVYTGAGIVGHEVPNVLRDTLRILRDAFGEYAQTWKAPHLIGLGGFLLKGENVKLATMLQKLQTYPGGAPAVEGKIRGRRTIMGGTMPENAIACYEEIYRRKAGSK